MIVQSETIHFEGRTDGPQGHLVRPSDGLPHPGIVLIQEWWGIEPHIRELAQRLAVAPVVVAVVVVAAVVVRQVRRSDRRRLRRQQRRLLRRLRHRWDRRTLQLAFLLVFQS